MCKNIEKDKKSSNKTLNDPKDAAGNTVCRSKVKRSEEANDGCQQIPEKAGGEKPMSDGKGRLAFSMNLPLECKTSAPSAIKFYESC